jgi:hypothetical protein
MSELRLPSEKWAAAKRVVLIIDNETIVLKQPNGSAQPKPKTETPLNLIYDATQLLGLVEHIEYPQHVCSALRAVSKTLQRAYRLIGPKVEWWSNTAVISDVVALLGCVDYSLDLENGDTARQRRYAIKCARHSLEEVQVWLRSLDFDRVAEQCKEAARG